jgi:hypothetical protein
MSGSVRGKRESLLVQLTQASWHASLSQTLSNQSLSALWKRTKHHSNASQQLGNGDHTDDQTCGCARPASRLSSDVRPFMRR